MTDVVERIVAEGVCFGVVAQDWRDLTAKVGEAMVQRGMVSAEYTQAMIGNVELNGPYLVIAPGVALLHARPDQGCLRNGILLGTATPPVEFGHSVNDPVSLFLGLSATGDMEHVSLLQSIALLLSEPNAITRLSEAPDESAFIQTLRDLEDAGT